MRLSVLLLAAVSVPATALAGPPPSVAEDDGSGEQALDLLDSGADDAPPAPDLVPLGPAFRLPATQLPAMATVISAEELAAWPATRPFGALAATPDVRLTGHNTGVSREASVSPTPALNPYDQTPVRVVLDGVSAVGFRGLWLGDPYSFESMTLVRGDTATLLGLHPDAGALVLTPRALPFGRGVTFGGSGGFDSLDGAGYLAAAAGYGTQSLAADVGAVAEVHSEASTLGPAADYTRVGTHAQLGWRVSPRTTVRAAFYGTALQQENFTELPRLEVGLDPVAAFTFGGGSHAFVGLAELQSSLSDEVPLLLVRAGHVQWAEQAQGQLAEPVQSGDDDGLRQSDSTFAQLRSTVLLQPVNLSIHYGGDWQREQNQLGPASSDSEAASSGSAFVRAHWQLPLHRDATFHLVGAGWLGSALPNAIADEVGELTAAFESRNHRSVYVKVMHTSPADATFDSYQRLSIGTHLAFETGTVDISVHEDPNGPVSSGERQSTSAGADASGQFRLTRSMGLSAAASLSESMHGEAFWGAHSSTHLGGRLAARWFASEAGWVELAARKDTTSEVAFEQVAGFDVGLRTAWELGGGVNLRGGVSVLGFDESENLESPGLHGWVSVGISR